jgi:hypothetical protein
MGERHSKDELIEMILSAGLLEDFLSYLKSRNIDADEKKLYDLDEKTLLDYAESKKLLRGADDFPEGQEDLYDRLEPNVSRPRTPPKKK